MQRLCKYSLFCRSYATKTIKWKYSDCQLPTLSYIKHFSALPVFLDSFWNFNSFFRQFLRGKNTWLFHCFVCHLKLSSFQACSEWTVKKRRTKERVSARLQRKTWFCSSKFWETGQCLLTLYRDTCWYLLILADNKWFLG